MSLAEGPPDLPYPKLPFRDTVGLAYSTYFHHFVDALRASWLWLIAAAAFTSVASWQQWSWIATLANLKPGVSPQMPKSTELAVLLNLDNIFLLLAGVSIAVAWHRLLILHEQPRFSGSNVATKDLWRYIVVAITLFLIFFLPVAAVVLPTFYFLAPASGPAAPPAGFFPLIVLGFVLYAVGAAVAFPPDSAAPGTGDWKPPPDLQADVGPYPRKYLAAVLGYHVYDSTALADCADRIFARVWIPSSRRDRQR